MFTTRSTTGLPVIMKTFTRPQPSDKEIVVTQFEGEHLAVQPTDVADAARGERLFVRPGQLRRDKGSGLGIHIGGGDGRSSRITILGGGTTRFIRDPDWGSMATLNQAEDLFLQRSGKRLAAQPAHRRSELDGQARRIL